MVAFALNHVTAPDIGWQGLAAMARRIGCTGVELRNDLNAPLFGSSQPQAVARSLQDAGLTLFAVAEISRFNDLDAAGFEAACDLIEQARLSGAEAVALIPRVGGAALPDTATSDALARLQPVLKAAGLRGLVEPIGFAASTLRSKSAALEAIAAAEAQDTYGLIHDTFHHHLAGETAFFPQETGLVHVSGVARTMPAAAMTDADRGLIDANDTLGTVAQLRHLINAGYSGPVSIEAFSPDVQRLEHPTDPLRHCIDDMADALGIRMPEPAT